ncbi:MAG: F0F1 ATP synthase subunit A [Anaerolineaceae bacterium]
MTEIVNSETQTAVHKKKSILWIVALVALVILNFVAVNFYKPIAPQISVGSESLLYDVVDGEIIAKPWFTLALFGDVYLTDSLLSVGVIFLVIILLAILVHRQKKDGRLQTHGVVLLLELVISALSNLADGAVEEKWRKKTYPFYLSIFFYVAFANLTKLLPFYESFGFAVPIEQGGYAAQKWLPWLYAITADSPAAGQQGYKVISFFRGAATDLNFTIGIAIAAVVAIQIVGMESRGFDYFSKFINIKAIIRNPKMGFIEFFIGILEAITEVAKIASFGFRLFGNMFAGMILLLFLGYMVPWVISSFIMLYEFFIGLLQAFVFGMLTVVFMGMAVKTEE